MHSNSPGVEPPCLVPFLALTCNTSADPASRLPRHPFSYPRIPPIRSAIPVTPWRPSLSSVPNSKAPTTLFIMSRLVRWNRFTRPGRRARQLPHTRHMRQTLVLPVRKSPTYLASPAAIPSAPAFQMTRTLRQSGTAGQAWWIHCFCLCSRSNRRPTTMPRVTPQTVSLVAAKFNYTLAWAGGSVNGKGGLSARNGGAK